jgi:hypothetical protein
MNSVLELLAIRNRNEQQELGAITGHDQAFLVSGKVRVFWVLDEVEYLGPENGLGVCIESVEGCMRDARCHNCSLDSS